MIAERAASQVPPPALARVIVRLPNWLGDALLARPLLHALRAAQPAAEIHALVPPAVAALLAGDGVWTASHAPKPDPAPAALHGADLALVLPPSFSSAWQALRLGARVRVGYAHEGRSPLLTRALRRPRRGDLHLSREYAALGSCAGVPASPPIPPPLALDASVRERAGAWLEARGLAGRPLALLGPGAVYGPSKRWPAERFAELGRRLAARGHAVLACGTAAEREACERVASAIPGARSGAGDTDLVLQAALCGRAAVAVCNDSGLAHLAAAAGAPTVAIFGSTSSAWTAPVGGRVRVVQRPPVCSPCFRRTCAIGFECLTRVEVERVDAACRELAA